MGVPLIPGRAEARSQPTRPSGASFDEFHIRPRLLAGTAVLAVTALAVAVAAGTIPLAAAAGVALLVPAAIVDIDQRRLPDVWVGGALAALIAVLVIGSAVGHPSDVDRTIGGVISGAAGGAIAMAVPVLLLHLVSPASMGFGDVKAAAVLGAAIGTIDWRLGVVALCIAALCGATVGVLARRRTIAFGPALVFGAWFALLAHDQILGGLFTEGLGT